VSLSLKVQYFKTVYQILVAYDYVTDIQREYDYIQLKAKKLSKTVKLLKNILTLASPTN